MNQVVSARTAMSPGPCQLLVLAISFAAALVSAKQSPSASDLPKVIYADPHAVADAKVKYLAGATSLKPAFDQLFAAAQKALNSKPVSVMDKNSVPPSGDKHDFMSQAPYFWPDTNSVDGRYIRRDGERNPESGKDSDAGRIVQVCANVHTLALAFYFTGNEAFAAHATELLRVWFLNPATRMNPNLNFGQGIPGEVDGRPMGIIGTRGFVELVDAIRLLGNSSSWTTADQKGMVAWMTEYLNWLQASKVGVGEGNATNNHGTFYDTQVAALAAFVGQKNLARQIILAAREKRIARQIETDGKMPRELQRTKSFSYSAFNLRALIDLASLGQNLGIDLWHYQTPDGRSIRKALEFMAPYTDRKNKWPYQQIDKIDRGSLTMLLLRAAPAFPDEHFQSLWKNAETRNLSSSEDRLLFPLGKIDSSGN
jgi:hypothetical protein